MTLWDSVDEIIDEVVSTLLEGASTFIESVQDLLTARLKVPWLTRLIENMILGGRELNTLRLFSLAAAIPVVISEVLGGLTASTRESELVIQRSAGTTDGDAEQEQTREWAERNYKEWSKTSSALGIANWVLWTVREMLTSSESMKKYADVPTVLQAMTLSGAGAVEFVRYYYASVLAEQDDDRDLANYIQAAASLNVIDAVCAMMEADAQATCTQVLVGSVVTPTASSE